MGKRTREWHSVTKNSFSVVESNTGEPVAIIKPWSKEVDERDARLIAAAPDLLEALENILHWIPVQHKAEAKAAIAAAKQGEE